MVSRFTLNMTFPDVDECSNGDNNCHNDARCTNTRGSFICACNSGFSGNGVTCAGWKRSNIVTNITCTNNISSNYNRVFSRCFYCNLEVLEWEQRLPTGTVSSQSVYCTSFESFQDGLAGNEFTSIEISAESSSRVCNDPVVANEIATAFSTCNLFCLERNFSCNGQTWRVGKCGVGGEINVGNSRCHCSGGGITIRPCINNNNWGGASQSCKSNSMTLRIAATIATSRATGKSY